MKACYTIRALAYAGALSHALPAHTEDFLGAGDFAFNSSEIEVKERSWSDGFKTALEHSQTQIPGEPSREQTSLRVAYEGNIADGWYLNLDTRYRYFWKDDDLAENRGGAYGHNKWQRAWLQYSRESCSATLGRQTLIWGTVEGTFVTDIVTPFDYTEQLLTDYGSVRLAQDMLVGECFASRSQLQVFYTPEARTDIYQHHPLTVDTVPGLAPVNLSVDPDEEWGVRYKWGGDGYDIRVMYARLFDNSPTLITKQSSMPPGLQIKPALAHFDLIGIAGDIAVGRLLLKGEVSHRSEQLIPFSNETTERYDAAVGFEYTTSSNHVFNAGLWGIHFNKDAIDVNDRQVLSLGWRKTYLNDNLAMSLLGNWASHPRFATITVLADYRWNDYWSSSFAITAADINEIGEGNPIVAAEESLTMSIKYEF